MTISEQTFELVALEDSDELWELVCGHLRAKPGMTARHNDLARQFLRRTARLLRETVIAREHEKSEDYDRWDRASHDALRHCVIGTLSTGWKSGRTTVTFSPR